MRIIGTTSENIRVIIDTCIVASELLHFDITYLLFQPYMCNKKIVIN